LLWI